MKAHKVKAEMTIRKAIKINQRYRISDCSVLDNWG